VQALSELENAEIAPGIDLVDRLVRALGSAAADLLPAAVPPEPLPVLREQTERLFGTLMEKGDRETFLRLTYTSCQESRKYDAIARRDAAEYGEGFRREGRRLARRGRVPWWLT
jgi:hypothetical protein